MVSIRFFVVPCFYIAPILSKYFSILAKMPGTKKIKPIKMVLFDQIIFSPVFSSSVIISLRLTECFSISESINSWKNEFLDIYKTSLAFWPFVQLANFYVVPVHFRVFVTQVAALIWNTYLSFKLNKDEEEHIVEFKKTAIKS
ncbi:Protein Mpv17 [Strongyloides ratti]|uniref:Mitochondrial inner membrane protein Mpv17 n=1 Tax=Strongyloides ratti TaxID=34506 RepID=A0A090LQV7_STRRB|nr:Protein Mpv17 [Strongyloides ratti]CEF69981.1 Protein Mpv17 [Strongyloides ratti]